MAYTKTVWEDLPSEDTPIVSTALNNIENGIETVDTALETVDTALNSGWISLTGTFTYSSADSPTFVMTTSVDLTGIVGLGMRIKLTQETTQYFIVTAITSTKITLYGGTDYTLTNASISNVYYSMLKAPFGFPLNPDKWCVVFTDTLLRTQSSPTANVWYNLGSLSFDVPIGIWKLKYDLSIAGTRGTSNAGNINVQVGIGTTNSTVISSFVRRTESTPATQQGYSSVSAENIISLASKTTYYINMCSGATNSTGIFEGNNNQMLVVRATIDYL